MMYTYTEERSLPKPMIRTRPGDLPQRLQQIAVRYRGSIRREDHDALIEAARAIVRMQDGRL